MDRNYDGAAQPWALLVATQHGGVAAAGLSREARLREVRQLLTRAAAIATPNRIVALISAQFESEWRDLAAHLPPHNLLVSSSSEAPVQELGRALTAIRARETECGVILIPADHCAAVESAWVMGAREALKLALDHRDTVYLLHDKPAAGPLPFAAANDMCSSTVVVGTTDSLIELCRGTRPSRLIDLTTADRPDEPTDDVVTSVAAAETVVPIEIIRIRSVEEYASLQRGDYARARANRIDIRV